MLVLVVLSSLISLVNAQLTISRPSASQWWIANSINTLAWSGTNPTQFSVFLTNPDTNILTDKLALESIIDTYIYSLDVNPGGITPGTGFQIQLTDPLNSTNVYATSESFEVKAAGSPYPPQITATPTGSSSGSGSSASGSSGSSGSGTASGTSSGTLASSTKKGAAYRTVGSFNSGMVGLVALAGMGAWIVL